MNRELTELECLERIANALKGAPFSARRMQIIATMAEDMHELAKQLVACENQLVEVKAENARLVELLGRCKTEDGRTPQIVIGVDGEVRT